jgi:hypothetical protein
MRYAVPVKPVRSATGERHSLSSFRVSEKWQTAQGLKMMATDIHG